MLLLTSFLRLIFRSTEAIKRLTEKQCSLVVLWSQSGDVRSIAAEADVQGLSGSNPRHPVLWIVSETIIGSFEVRLSCDFIVRFESFFVPVQHLTRPYFCGPVFFLWFRTSAKGRWRFVAESFGAVWPLHRILVRGHKVMPNSPLPGTPNARHTKDATAGAMPGRTSTAKPCKCITRAGHSVWWVLFLIRRFPTIPRIQQFSWMRNHDRDSDTFRICAEVNFSDYSRTEASSFVPETTGDGRVSTYVPYAYDATVAAAVGLHLLYTDPKDWPTKDQVDVTDTCR